jgi:hypothetical protein
MALDATIKGSSSNSYATVAQADAYFADRLGSSSWNSIGDEIINISSATISGVYSSVDNQTEVTVASIVAPSPGLALGDSMQMVTDVVGVDGTHFITKVVSSTSFKFLVSGDQSTVSALTYLDRSTYSDKAKALIMATRYLDQLMYFGERTTTTQKLSFPRMFLTDPDATAMYWGQALRLRTDYFDENTIPDRILFATYELALRLLSDPELTGDPTVRQFRKVSIDGVLSVEFNSNSLVRPLDRNILNYISPLLKSGGSSTVLLRR